MRVGLLTGGGDCPGLNAVIRGIVRKGVQEHGYEFVGYRDGWRGPLEGDATPLAIPDVRGTLPRGGTILGSSRVNPLTHPDGIDRIRKNLASDGVDALIVIGGENTLAVAAELHRAGVPIVAVPKTIDNDLNGTDYTFGFNTAVTIATETIDRLHTTAESHKRALIVEVMGRHTGWIAVHAGLAGGGNATLIPEQRFDIEQVCRWVESRYQHNYAPIVVVAEGAAPLPGQLQIPGWEGDRPGPDAFAIARLSGIGEWVAGEVEKRTGHEARTTVLGQVQRGGTPTPFDRWLATRFGLHAVDAVRDADWGSMIALHGENVVRVPLSVATESGRKVVPASLYEEVSVFFG